MEGLRISRQSLKGSPLVSRGYGLYLRHPCGISRDSGGFSLYVSRFGPMRDSEDFLRHPGGFHTRGDGKAIKRFWISLDMRSWRLYYVGHGIRDKLQIGDSAMRTSSRIIARRAEFACKLAELRRIAERRNGDRR